MNWIIIQFTFNSTLETFLFITYINYFICEQKTHQQTERKIFSSFLPKFFIMGNSFGQPLNFQPNLEERPARRIWPESDQNCFQDSVCHDIVFVTVLLLILTLVLYQYYSYFLNTLYSSPYDKIVKQLKEKHNFMRKKIRRKIIFIKTKKEAGKKMKEGRIGPCSSCSDYMH